jgi:hypothetical protein
VGPDVAVALIAAFIANRQSTLSPVEQAEAKNMYNGVASDPSVAEVPWTYDCPKCAYPVTTHTRYAGYGLHHAQVQHELLEIARGKLLSNLTSKSEGDATAAGPAWVAGTMLPRYWPAFKSWFPALADLLERGFWEVMNVTTVVDQAVSIANYATRPNNSTATSQQHMMHKINSHAEYSASPSYLQRVSATPLSASQRTTERQRCGSTHAQ